MVTVLADTCIVVEPVINQRERERMISWWLLELDFILVARMHWSMLEFPHIVLQLSNTATQQIMDNTVVQTEAHTLKADNHAAKSARLGVWTDPR